MGGALCLPGDSKREPLGRSDTWNWSQKTNFAYEYILCFRRSPVVFFLSLLRLESLLIISSRHKSFLGEQCKEIEKNNRMWKTRDLFKKIRDTKGTFHAKRGTIKYRKGMDLTEAEDIKKRLQEYTEELYTKDLNDPDNHNGVISHLELDILECEVKWVMIMNKS